MIPSAETPASKLDKNLGEAVVRSWSSLPQDVQHQLFEEPSMAAGKRSERILQFFSRKASTHVHPFGEMQEY